MSRVKIAFVTTTIETGGAEAMLLKLVTRIDKARFVPSIIVLASTTPLSFQLERAGATVTALGMRGAFDLFSAPAQLVRVVHQLKPDLLQGWMLHGNLAAQIVGTLLRIPVVWGVRHSRLVPGTDKRLSRMLDQKMKCISRLPIRIVYNSHDGRLHHEELGYRANKSIVIPNGFDLSRFIPDESARERHRAAFGIASDTVVIGMVARFHPMKDHATFLQAAQMLSNRYLDVLFVLAGRGCDASNRILVHSIDQLGLGNALLLLGERQDVDSLANAFDIGTLSSASGEGFPNVIGESMACGVPCVVTNVGDSSLVIGDTGISIPPRDPSALAEGWGKLIDMGREGRALLGKEARARIAGRFSIESVTRSFEALYLEAKSAGT